jgi:hypothetical protein
MSERIFSLVWRIFWKICYIWSVWTLASICEKKLAKMNIPIFDFKNVKTVKESIFNLLFKLWVNDMIAITYHFFGNDIYMPDRKFDIYEIFWFVTQLVPRTVSRLPFPSGLLGTIFDNYSGCLFSKQIKMPVSYQNH